MRHRPLLIGMITLLLSTWTAAQAPRVLDYQPGSEFWRSARNCGVNCMYLMLRSRVAECDYEALVAATSIDERGSTPVQLRDGAARVGFDTEIAKAAPTDLESIELPVVLYLTEFSDKMGEAGHYVVLTDLSEGGDSAHVFDGTTAMAGDVPMEKLRRAWTGILIRPVAAAEWALPRSAALLGGIAVMLLAIAALRSRRAVPGIARLAVTLAVLLPAALTAQIPSPHADAEESPARSEPAAPDLDPWMVRYAVRRSSPLAAPERADRGLDDRALESSICEFRYVDGGWTFAHERSGGDITHRQTVSFDGKTLINHRVGAPAMVLDVKGMSEQLQPNTTLYSVTYLELTGWSAPNTPATIDRALVRAVRPARCEGDPSSVEHEPDGTVRTTWSERTRGRTKTVWTSAQANGAMLRSETRQDGELVDSVVCDDWHLVGRHLWPWKVTRTHFCRGSDGRVSERVLLVEEFEVTGMWMDDRQTELANLQPSPGSVVYDSRYASEGVGKQGLVGYVVPHDPDHLFREFEASLGTRREAWSTGSTWALALGALAVAACVAYLIVRQARRRVTIATGSLEREVQP